MLKFSPHLSIVLAAHFIPRAGWGNIRDVTSGRNLISRSLAGIGNPEDCFVTPFFAGFLSSNYERFSRLRVVSVPVLHILSGEKEFEKGQMFLFESLCTISSTANRRV